MTDRFTNVGKEILKDGVHYADFSDDVSAKSAVDMLNRSDQGQLIRAALDERDRKAKECPDAKLDPDKDCPRCGASSNQGCYVTALADAAFVHNARTILARISTEDVK